MKKIAVLSLFIVLSISVYSQSDNWYFSFSMGGSRPMGTFSKSDINNSESGYAKNGFALLLDATFPMNDHWGLKGMTLLSTNPIDRNGLGSKLETRMNGYSITVPDADRQYISLDVNSWMWNALLVGPVFTVKLNRIFWDIQLLGGMNVGYLPQQKFSFNKPTNGWYYLDSNTTTTSISLGVIGGSDFRFPVTNRMNLKIGVDYYRSGAMVKYEQTKVTQQGQTTVTQTLGGGETKIPIEMLTGSIGLVYYLN